MGEASGRERVTRGPVVAIAAAVLLVALVAGAVWSASATADEPGHRIDVAPVIDADPLESAATPSPGPAPATDGAPGPTPQPVPPPTPVDVGDDVDDGADDEFDDDTEDDLDDE